HVDSAPCLIRACNLSRVSIRPAACLLHVRISPSQDLRDRERWQVVDISDAAMFGQQISQRPSSGKAASTSVKCVTDCGPCFFGAGYVPGLLIWPVARYFVVRVSPAQNSLDRQRWLVGRLFDRPNVKRVLEARRQEFRNVEMDVVGK